MAATQDDFSRVQAVYIPVGAAALVVVAGAFAFALVRYRARDGRAAADREHNALEALIALGIAIVVAALVVVTFGTDENEARVRGRPAFRVDAVAFKWGWQFTYPALPGVVDRTVRLIPPVLHVPAGVEVAVRLSTRDTTHALWTPDVRYKRDAWLGVAQTFALTFPPGQHISGRCAQYCGLHHSDTVFTVAWTRGVRGVGRAGAGPEAGTVSLVAPRPPYAPVRGVAGAVVATDDKAVAARTLVTAFGFFIAGGVIALLMRLELATPGTSPTAARCPRRARRTPR